MTKTVAGYVLIGLVLGLCAGALLASFSERRLALWILKTLAFGLLGLSLGAIVWLIKSPSDAP